jgi:NAD(P)H-nitrite reductase large subunit
MMDDDDDICLCFHVSKRKLIQYIRVKKPQVVSQLSECYGAGAGCGWCRPFLQRLFNDPDSGQVSLPDPQSYAADRQQYRRRKRAQ